MIASFPDGTLDAISRTLGEAMIGSDITRVFAACGISDTSGESTKWKRLYGTFSGLQARDRCANNVVAFIESAMSPARWSNDPDRHSVVCEGLNRALLFAGIEIDKRGKAVSVKAASSLDEATERANRLRARLRQRGVHAEVLRSCHRLVLKDANYFTPRSR